MDAYRRNGYGAGSRTTAWRRVKEVIAAAGITGTPAMPKGLQHGFGVNAFQSSVPPHLVQRWRGHASLRTRRSMAMSSVPKSVLLPRECGKTCKVTARPLSRADHVAVCKPSISHHLARLSSGKSRLVGSSLVRYFETPVTSVFPFVCLRSSTPG